MTEVLVSIRLPSEMARELRKLAERRRYLDVSEALRDIIRQRWHRDEQPLLYELDRMRVELKQEMRILKQAVEGSR
ncbi:ribbon-helix-helix protein, CopG family [Candidatus Woesearchaeota archaeon]|nr:ribbon-helix-helix protein, CopG family [Candidatus Woesearchaeota archaeon]